MQVLGLVGSARKQGNTDILVEAVLAAARAQGHDAVKIHLHDLDIGPCRDCRGCKTGELTCVVEDGMQEVYARLDAADAIVFGTPVYWCGPSATMKLALDRLRPYFASHGLKGKKTLLVALAGDGPPQADLLVRMFKRSFRALEMEHVGEVLATGYDRGDVLRDAQALAQAAALGTAL
jgi:multimeric flavodoxin WrbA